MGAERRGRIICCWFMSSTGCFAGRNCVGELTSPGKPFSISKLEVWEAYRQVKANKGAPGADGQSIEGFEADLRNNLFKIWNRMSSGSYFPPAVKAVEIPKPHGGGVWVLGVPTVADRIAQTVVARRIEAKAEPVFHPDSYGYRPGRSALDAVAACRRHDWVIDLDVQKFFDSVPHDLIIKAVQAHCSEPWVVLYVRRWLTGTAAPRRAPRYRRCWRTCSCTTRSMRGWPGNGRAFRSSVTPTYAELGISRLMPRPGLCRPGRLMPWSGRWAGSGCRHIPARSLVVCLSGSCQWFLQTGR